MNLYMHGKWRADAIFDFGKIVRIFFPGLTDYTQILHNGRKCKPKIDHMTKNDIELKFKMAAATILNYISENSYNFAAQD